MAIIVLELFPKILSLIFDFMMNIIRRIFSFGRICEPEPGLDPHSIKLVRDSWMKVEKAGLQETGLVVFKRLFEIAPYLRDLFPFGYDPESKDLRTHALGVMNTVGLAVRGIKDMQSLKPKLVELGSIHKGFELTDKEFNYVGEAILWTLENALGDSFTPEVKAAWVEAYTTITSAMKEGLK